MKARPGKFTDEKDRDDRWWSRYEKQVENAQTIDWDNYPMKDTYGEKLVPPILPAYHINLDEIKRLVNQYLCTNCCSHRVVRSHHTAPGCVDVIEMTTNA